MNTQAMLSILEDMKNSSLNNDELEAIEDIEYAVSLGSGVALRQHFNSWSDDFYPTDKYQQMIRTVEIKFIEEGLL